MALPKLEATRYTCELPLSKKTVEYRPFLVKEQKHLLVAGESEDGKVITKSLIDLIESCTYGDLRVNKIPMADVEFLFLQIRIKSAGETSDVQLQCEKCEEPNPVSIDLTKVRMETENLPDGHIKLSDTMGMNLVWPAIEQVNEDDKTTDSEQVFKIISGSIESVYNGDEVFTRDDWNEKEINEFIDSLNIDQFQLVQEFLTNIPRIEETIEFCCVACCADNKRVLSGIQDFFS